MGDRPTTAKGLTCSKCGREIGSMLYRIGEKVLCPDCYCKKFGVCG